MSKSWQEEKVRQQFLEVTAKTSATQTSGNHQIARQPICVCCLKPLATSDSGVIQKHSPRSRGLQRTGGFPQNSGFVAVFQHDGIGAGCRIENTIIDKNARVGDNVVISPFGKPENVDHELYYIRDGIVIIPKNTDVPAGTRI